jgi:hypothetical protein
MAGLTRRLVAGGRKSWLDTQSRTNLVLHALLQTLCNKNVRKSSVHQPSRRRRHLPDPCEPRLSPLRDDNDFILLRCDANCFHLVLPFLSIHLTGEELKTATQALRTLWTKRARKAKTSKQAVKAEPETPRQNVLFQAFRCPGGHCHLVCHGTLNICLKEKAARLLQEEMEAQAVAEPILRPAPAYLV